LIESQLARRPQVAFGAPPKPDVEVSSSFPPELLLGRIDRIQVTMDQMSRQGVVFYNVRADLGGAKASVSSLLEGEYQHRDPELHLERRGAHGVDRGRSAVSSLPGSRICLVNRPGSPREPGLPSSSWKANSPRTILCGMASVGLRGAGVARGDATERAQQPGLTHPGGLNTSIKTSSHPAGHPGQGTGAPPRRPRRGRRERAPRS
jgi:hypothetical protein